MREVYSEILHEIKDRPHPRCSIIPPNRLEIRNKELFLALFETKWSRPLSELRVKLKEMTGAKQIVFAPSCRAAIALILSLLPQREVVLPAYTCPVVKNAALIAGKNVIYVDISKKSLNATSEEFAEKAKPGRILIPTHIFGLPTDIEAICNLAKTNDCIIIEDAAAAFGARLKGRLLGTFGDFGVFSFEKSKRLPAFRGAAIIVNNEKLIKAEMIEKIKLVDTELKLPIREIFQTIIYNITMIPWIYGRETLPLILRGYCRASYISDPKNLEAEKQTAFYKRAFHPYQAALVLRMLKRLDCIRARIAELVEVYKQILSDSGVITFIPPECDHAGLLRFPVALPHRDRREILRMALARGLFLEINYKQPLPEKHEWDRYPNAKWAAQNIILLPLYARLLPNQAANIADVLKCL